MRLVERPRNDAHIMYLNHDFESLRTAYNRKKQSKMQALQSTEYGEYPHIFPTNLSQPHNTVHILFEQVGQNPAKL
jgi:hypothetical protein